MRHPRAGSQLLYRRIRLMPGSHGRVGRGGHLAEQEPTGRNQNHSEDCTENHTMQS